MTGLSLSANWKNNNYDSILVIVNHLTKIIDYKLFKVIINAPRLAKVIINIVLQYHDLLDSIISDRRAIFTLKFCFSLYYFLDIQK